MNDRRKGGRENRMDVDERQAIQHLKDGDISGLSVLVYRHQAKAIRSAYLVTGDRAMAEDIVQAAFVRAYERIDQFDANRPFAPWFLRSVINDALKALQRRGRQVLYEPEFEAWFIDGDPNPDTQLDDKHFRQAVRAALDKLTPKQRAAVVMRYYLGMSEREIAEFTEAPRGTVKSRLHSARSQLRKLLHPLLEWR
jgi:RNA polymerase sigma-70 factor (ECF subfamily)